MTIQSEIQFIIFILFIYSFGVLELELVNFFGNMHNQFRRTMSMFLTSVFFHINNDSLHELIFKWSFSFKEPMRLYTTISYHKFKG